MAEIGIVQLEKMITEKEGSLRRTMDALRSTLESWEKTLQHNDGQYFMTRRIISPAADRFTQGQWAGIERLSTELMMLSEMHSELIRKEAQQ